MNTNFDDIEKSLNVEKSIIKKDNDKPELPNVVLKKDDIEKDYNYTRGQLYSLIEKGQEAINGIMELAGESASPRAYEVAGQLIKSVADSTDKLMDLQKKVKEIDEDSGKSQGNVTNNALFVGSTTELSKMLKKGFLNNNDTKTAEWWNPVKKDTTIVTLRKNVCPFLMDILFAVMVF